MGLAVDIGLVGVYGGVASDDGVGPGENLQFIVLTAAQKSRADLTPFLSKPQFE